eukprot:634662-Prymnesium_polylepis.1
MRFPVELLAVFATVKGNAAACTTLLILAVQIGFTLCTDFLVAAHRLHVSYSKWNQLYWC